MICEAHEYIGWIAAFFAAVTAFFLSLERKSNLKMIEKLNKLIWRQQLELYKQDNLLKEKEKDT